MAKAYHGGQFFKAIGETFDTIENKDKVISADVLDAWFDPSPKVIKKLSDNLNFSIKTSPPTHCEGLIKTISEVRGVAQENILVGGGSSDIMFYFLPNYFSKESKIMILDPTYGEYSHILQHVIGANYSTYTLSPEHEFEIKTEELITQVNTEKPDAIIIVNPSSPTGKYRDKNEVLRVVKSINKDILIIIDETYIEYIGTAFSLEKEVALHKNLVIIKSMSKVYALSGLRAAYMVADKSIITKIVTFIPPRAVSLPAQMAAIEALRDSTYYQKKYEETHSLRKNMEAELGKIEGVRVFQGTANFILLSIAGTGIRSDLLVEEMRKDNVYIRDCSPWSKALGFDYVRIAIKDQQANNIVLKSFKNAINRKMIQNI